MSDDRSVLTPHDEERLARYRCGEMTSEERGAFEAELLHNDSLMEALYQDVSLDQSLRELPPRSWGADAEPRPSFWRSFLQSWIGPRRWIALSAAATVAVVLLMFRPAPEPHYRGDTPASRAIAPVGLMRETPTRFVWTKAPGAIRYRFVLYDEQFRAVATRVVNDTTLSALQVLPSDLHRGAWQITPIDAHDQMLLPTPPTRFEIAR